MSTVYLLPRPPISKLKVERRYGHVAITVFVNGVNAGDLVIEESEVEAFSKILFEHGDDRDAAAFRWFTQGGAGMRWNPEAEEAPALYREGRLLEPTTLADLCENAVVCRPWGDDDDDESHASPQLGE